MEDNKMLSTIALFGSALLLGGGILLLTAGAAWIILPLGLITELPDSHWVINVTLMAVGLCLATWSLLLLRKQVGPLEALAESFEEPKRSTELYGMHLVGIGFALLVQALMCVIVVMSLCWSVGQRWSQTAMTPEDLGEWVSGGFLGSNATAAYFIGAIFALSSIVAMLGALFFFANSLWNKIREPDRESFDKRVFWGGLWFRIGEAVLFNLVFFLLLRKYAPGSYLLLPLVSLLVGMFLKLGEGLVAGIAKRLFASIQALVPGSIEPQRIRKLMSFKLAGFQSVDSASVSRAIKEVATTLKQITGIDAVDFDESTRAVRVEYNPSSVTPGDVRRKVELRGLELEHPEVR